MVWHEDETFWELIQEFVFPPEKIEEAAEQVEQLLALLDLDEEARVLDVPCGVGRHALELARRGFGVTAVDVTEAYLETAREWARDADVDSDIEFVRADMREFRREAEYDAVLNLYTSFGYFEDQADDERVARNFYESLRSGGRLAMSLTSKEILARDFQSRDWHERDGAFMLEEREVVDDWSRLENRWIVVGVRHTGYQSTRPSSGESRRRPTHSGRCGRQDPSQRGRGGPGSASVSVRSSSSVVQG